MEPQSKVEVAVCERCMPLLCCVEASYDWERSGAPTLAALDGRRSRGRSAVVNVGPTLHSEAQHPSIHPMLSCDWQPLCTITRGQACAFRQALLAALGPRSMLSWCMRHIMDPLHTTYTCHNVHLANCARASQHVVTALYCTSVGSMASSVYPLLIGIQHAT